jgi:hypothetical protein
MPSHPAGWETRENPTRLKNLLREAHVRLVAAGVKAGEAQERLAPAARLVADDDFWRHGGHGLAIYIGARDMHVYRVPLELPEMVVVGEQFHLKPLVGLAVGGGRFYILALSQDAVRMFAASRFHIEPVDLPGAPRNFGELERFIVAERSMQLHSGTHDQHPGKGRRSVIFHGQGGGNDETLEKRRLVDYCNMVDGAVRKLLATQDAPLVLAAPEPLAGLYRHANCYPYLQKQVVHGNQKAADIRTLHEQALEVVKDILDEGLRLALMRFERSAGTKLTSVSLPDILQAARAGRVDSLLVAVDEEKWGRFEPAEGVVDIHAARQNGDEELVNLAIAVTYAQAGSVHPLEKSEMPGGNPVAAMLRW